MSDNVDTSINVSLKKVDSLEIPKFIGSLYPYERKLFLKQGYNDLDRPLALAIIERPEERRSHFVRLIMEAMGKAGFEPEEKDLILKNGGFGFLPYDELYHLGIVNRKPSIKGLEFREVLYIITNLSDEERLLMVFNNDPELFDKPLARVLDDIDPEDGRLDLLNEFFALLEPGEIKSVYESIAFSCLTEDERRKVESSVVY